MDRNSPSPAWRQRLRSWFKSRIVAPEPRCSFCDKTQSEVGKLIVGPGTISICPKCVGVCQAIIERRKTTPD